MHDADLDAKRGRLHFRIRSVVRACQLRYDMKIAEHVREARILPLDISLAGHRSEHGANPWPPSKRWPTSSPPSVGRKNDGFIHGGEMTTIISELTRDILTIASEDLWRVRPFETSPIDEPLRQREVPERYEGFYVSRTKSRQDSAIVFYFAFIERAFFWFDASPLDRDTVTGVPKTFCDIKIFFVPCIVFAGSSTRGYFFLSCRFSPIAIFYSAFDLVRGGRCTP